MTKKRAVQLVMRFFAADLRQVECEAKSKGGLCLLVAHRFSRHAGEPGERFVLARAKSWEQCVRQVVPAGWMNDA